MSAGGHRGMGGLLESLLSAVCVTQSAICTFSKKVFPIGGASRQMRSPSSFGSSWRFLQTLTHRGSREPRDGGEGRDPGTPSLPLLSALLLHVRAARLWKRHSVAMATDCDVSNPGPGPPTTSGCERWVCCFRQGWTSALGLGRWPAGRPACGPDPGSSPGVIEVERPGSRGPSPS